MISFKHKLATMMLSVGILFGTAVTPVSVLAADTTGTVTTESVSSSATESSSNTSSSEAISSSESNTTSDKSIASNFNVNKQLDTAQKLKRGDTVTFDLFFRVNDTEPTKSVLLGDTLNKNLTYKSARVLDRAMADVTGQGKNGIQFAKETNTVTWTANKPADWFGQYLDLQITAVVNKDTDATEITNEGWINVNGHKTPTTDVKITLDKKPETPAPASTPDKDETGTLPQTKQAIKAHPVLATLSFVIAIGLIGSIVYLIKKYRNK